MEPQARYALVGVVILVLAAALVVFILWLNRAGLERGTEPFLIFFRHQSLDGLQINSDVKMRGIKVGYVARFQIEEGDANAVRVLIRVNADTPVRKSTQATIVRNLVTGLAAIHLINTDDKSLPNTEPPPGLPHPVIAEAEGTQEVTDALSRFAEEGVKTLEQLQRVLTDDNIARIRGTLSNLENLTLQLEQQAPALREALLAVTRAAGELTAASATIGRAAEGLDHHVGEIAQGTQEVLAEARQTLAEARARLDSLERDLATVAGDLERLSDTGKLELQATARELRAAADSLSRTARRLEDPRAVLFGPHAAELGPGERR